MYTDKKELLIFVLIGWSTIFALDIKLISEN